ncbi:MAG: hypothetical protein OEN56_10495 [Gemmatimonadota bacterium]|nr:hypothetical protein [Gemmatimonadota bacterium]
MEEFRAFIRILTVASLALAAVQIYLTLNKLWSRKHEKVVAESISIFGELLGLVPLAFLTLSFILDGQWEGVVDGVLWLGAGAVTIGIGAGMWVEGRRGRGFWRLLRDAMALERTEVGDLARSFFRPSGADEILRLLARIALIDEHLDDRERSFIASFADAWGIELSWDELAQQGEQDGVRTIELRDAVADYLSTSPPTAQVEQLGDVIVALVHADEEVSSNEDLMLAELSGMFDAYVSGSPERPRFEVALVPQSEEQDAAIRAVLPGVVKENVAGGSAYVVGRYFSERYAETVREQYQALNVFTTVLKS